MRQEAIEAIVCWQNTLGDQSALEITFHGGEPLVPGAGFYRIALPLLRDGLAPRKVRFGVQSNLWLLTDELCDLFFEYDVSLGTSLDGPEPINDAQRGEGHFRRTMQGIERARARGLDVGCICTFTAQSAPRYNQVFDFFVRAGLNFSIHAALPSLTPSSHLGGDSGIRASNWILSPKAHGQLLVNMLERYLAQLDRIRITTLDSMCRSISAGRGGICTFDDCLGKYLAVDPEGWIYACQRFAGVPTYRLGNIYDCPSQEALAEAPAWRMLQERQEHIEEECGDCPHLDFCRGGCPYNVLAANGGFERSLRDPHCPAYQRGFNYITDRALEEVFSEENLTAVAEGGPGKYGLMRKGKLLQIVRGGPHPHKVYQQARKIVSAVALAVSDSPISAAQRLDRAGLITDYEHAVRSLMALQAELYASLQAQVKVFIHVTYACNLVCTHCYASAGPGKLPAMPVADTVRLVREAAAAGFHKAFITGGEPMVHPQRDAMLDALAALRGEVRPLTMVLRTNLAYPLKPTLIERLACSTDQVVVSVDGNEASHDARRGTGAYARTVANLRALLESSGASGTVKVSITAVLTAAQAGGPEGDAVRALGKELGVMVSLKPVLPLGRAVEMPLQPEFYSSLEDDAEAIAYGAHIAATCGLGVNLYIGPGGECFPCYALRGARHALGNALDNGLATVLDSERYRSFKQVTVDSNRQCRHCALRYLCGGFCQAWSNSDDPDAPPTDCKVLYERARGLLLGALRSLSVDTDRWQMAGLPLAYAPPTWREAMKE